MRIIKSLFTVTLGVSLCVYIGYLTQQQSLAAYNTAVNQPAEQFEISNLKSQILTYEANVSAYCPCEKCCGKWANIHPRRTASGHIIKPGDKFVASPKDVPFGTMIDIPGYGLVPVLDRGGAIKGNKLDVYFDSHQEALEWGRQYLTVKIYPQITQMNAD